MDIRQPLKAVLTPFQRFVQREAASGILLIAAAAVALLWANSPWAAQYFHLWEIEFALEFGEARLSKTLHHWINDGLMALFFFLVGLEIKREVLEGELSSWRQASLPFLAALGGMLVPVALFLLLFSGPTGEEGWGIPMATDIAFSLGILSLLGNRVTLGMNVFLTAFAIVDDIGAVLVIALFYSQNVDPTALLYGLGALGLLLGANYLGVKNPWVYAVLGLVSWYFFETSGIHATIAGVLAAFCIPTVNRTTLDQFLEAVRQRVKRLRRRQEQRDGQIFLPEEDLKAIEAIKAKARAVEPPLQRLEEGLNRGVVFVVVPLFALANAGVNLQGTEDGLWSGLSLSIAVALVGGKLLGIFSFSWGAVRAGLADLPEGSGWWQLAGMALLGGVGFTMALFIANLAFDAGGTLDQAKIGILLGSTVAGLAGYLVLRFSTAEQ